jgi:hypothetical protein
MHIRGVCLLVMLSAALQAGRLPLARDVKPFEISERDFRKMN